MIYRNIQSVIKFSVCFGKWVILEIQDLETFSFFNNIAIESHCLNVKSEIYSHKSKL